VAIGNLGIPIMYMCMSLTPRECRCPRRRSHAIDAKGLTGQVFDLPSDILIRIVEDGDWRGRIDSRRRGKYMGKKWHSRQAGRLGGIDNVISRSNLDLNVHVSADEIDASQLGSNANTHHQSLLIGFLHPVERGIVGYGANNMGSNHTARSRDSGGGRDLSGIELRRKNARQFDNDSLFHTGRRDSRSIPTWNQPFLGFLDTIPAKS
jgi:hypothetical protein